MPIVGVEKDGLIYANTTVQIPLELRKKARREGISISRICTDALRQAIEGCNAEKNK